MENVGYYNGEIAPLEELKIPALDRAVYFGDGCYDFSMYKNGEYHNLDMHLDRFYNSARLLRIELPWSRDEIKAEFKKIGEAFDGDEGALYWQASRATAFRSHAYPHEGSANLLAFLRPSKATDPSKEFKCITFEDKRFKYCNIKTLNLLPNCMAATAAEEAGCNEVIYVRDGYVTEMAHSNVSFLVDGKLVYHPFDNLILPGISIKCAIKACERLGIPTEARALTQVEAMNADELIASSSSTFFCRINTVDNIPVGGKDPELFKRIQNAVYDEYNALGK